MTLADYTRTTKTLGDTVTVTLPDGSSFQAQVLSTRDTEGLQAVTLGYAGAASELYQHDAANRVTEKGR